MQILSVDTPVPDAGNTVKKSSHIGGQHPHLATMLCGSGGILVRAIVTPVQEHPGLCLAALDQARQATIRDIQ